MKQVAELQFLYNQAYDYRWVSFNPSTIHKNCIRLMNRIYYVFRYKGISLTSKTFPNNLIFMDFITGVYPHGY